MVIGILKENASENRVAMLPGEVAGLKKLGVEVIVESSAGNKAYASDNDYISSGASVVSRNDIISKSEILLSIHPPFDDVKSLRKGQLLFCVLNPTENKSWIEQARIQGITIMSLDLVPRITRAQSMDILSSMATVSGYKAVLEAASLLPRFFPMFMSAAGTIKPSRVLIIGAGVAGLQALAIARKLGAVVEVFDVRSAVKEEVKSLGGKFIEVEGAKEDKAAGGYAVEQSEEFKLKQQNLIQHRAIVSDIIITTAQIPGKKAPVLILKETVNSMRQGSVIIDLAASSGGNCELTKNGETITVNGVKIVGKSDYPSEMSTDASRMFGNNLLNLLKIMIVDGRLVLDEKDEIIAGTIAIHNNAYYSDRIKQMLKIE